MPSLETEEPEDSHRDLSCLLNRGLLTQSPGVTPYPVQQAVDRTQQQSLLREKEVIIYRELMSGGLISYQGLTKPSNRKNGAVM